MNVNALVNGTGIMVHSLCNDCVSTIAIQNDKYQSNFCVKCDKRTSGMNYPGHVEKFPESFYEFNKSFDGQSSNQPDPGRTWKEMVPCSVVGRETVVSVVLAGCCKNSVAIKDGVLSFNFCVGCQKRTTWAKYPKPFKKIS
ncbi:unnamed protein product [Caenorhabditis brenneri]